MKKKGHTFLLYPFLPPSSPFYLGRDLDAGVLGDELGGNGHPLVDGDAALGMGILLLIVIGSIAVCALCCDI